MMNKRLKLEQKLSECLTISQYGCRGKNVLGDGILQAVLPHVPDHALEQLTKSSAESKWQQMEGKYLMQICDFLDLRTILIRVSRVCKRWAWIVDTHPWYSCLIMGMKFSESLQRTVDFPRVWKSKFSQLTRLRIDPPLYPVTDSYLLYTAPAFLPRLVHLSAPLTLSAHALSLPKVTYLDDFTEHHMDDLPYLRHIFPNVVKAKLRVWMCKMWLKDHWDRRRYISEDRDMSFDEKETFDLDLAKPEFYQRYFEPWRTVQEIQLSVRYDLKHEENDKDTSQYVEALLHLLYELFGTRLTKLQLMVNFQPRSSFSSSNNYRKRPNKTKFVKLKPSFWKALEKFEALQDLSLNGFSFSYCRLVALKNMKYLEWLVIRQCMFIDKLLLSQADAQDIRTRDNGIYARNKEMVYQKVERKLFPLLPHLKHLVLFDCFEKLPKPSTKRLTSLITIHAYYFMRLLQKSWVNLLQERLQPQVEISASKDHCETWKHECWKRFRDWQDWGKPDNWKYNEYLPRSLGNCTDWHFIYNSIEFLREWRL